MSQIKRNVPQALLATIVAMLAPAATAWAQGETVRVHLVHGQTAIGRLSSATRDKVVVGSSPPKEYAVNEVKYIQLPGEPRDLMEARNAIFDGHFEQAVEALGRIPPTQLTNADVRQDVDYYRALATARRAAGGVGDARAAGTALLAFITANKNSYHFYEANEAAGDLLVAIGRYDQAPTFYGELASAPWPDYKMRAAVLLGRALQAQGKHEEASKQFDAALALNATGKAAESHKFAARIGKAKCLVEMGQAKESIALLEEILQQAPAENNYIYALTYNALGRAYVKLKQPKDALHAYLHVDVLYNQSPDQHAEALAHLKQLWEELNKPERAKEAGDLLRSRYATSPWNK